MLVGLEWAESMMFLLLHVTCSCIFHAYIPLFSIFLNIIVDWYFFACLSLSLSFFQIVCTWHLSANPLCPKTLFVPRHPLLLILHPFMSSSVMINPISNFQRTFLNEAFIQNTRLFFRISPILIYPLSITIGVRNPFVISWLVVPS